MKPLLGLLLLCGLAAAQGPPAATVETAVAEECEVQASRTFAGTILPVRTAAVGSEVDGKVLEFLVRAGDRVETGQPLARLDTGSLDLQIAVVRAALQRERAELLELRNGPRPQEIAEAKARAEAAEATVTYADWKLSNSERLFQGGNLSEDDLQASRSAAIAARKLAEASRAQLELLEKGTRAERIAQAEARTLEREQEILRLEDQRARHEVKAPFAGYVVREETEVGEWLSRGGLVAEVMELDRIDVLVPVPETNVAAIRKGMEARLAVEALPKEAFLGAVESVVPSGDVRSRTFPVKVRLENRRDGGAPLLKAGMLVRVSLPVGEVRKALLVPQDAVVLGGSSPLVYVATEDPQRPGVIFARPVPVETGASYDGRIEVKGLLRAGDPVVVRGNERIFPMQPLQIAKGK
jgi:RND family efflux transporter MFP subunit